jgi:mannitol/fructose-specific phosphotransferase system IIA component (Ntr-type)
VGISPAGLDFDAPDGEPARIVIMILTPLEDSGAQLELLAEVSRLFRLPEVRERALSARSFTELRALLNVEGHA